MFLDVCACGAQGEMRFMQIRDYPVCKTRNHHHVSLRYFGHLQLPRQTDEITPLYGGIASIKKPPNWRLVVFVW